MLVTDKVPLTFNVYTLPKRALLNIQPRTALSIPSFHHRHMHGPSHANRSAK